ncbi:MAG: aminotransferase class III-fold pyridoxal phosphate-dependent enzyme, partial [Rhodococcus sp. (in: high G+C Gram-positive bacteria)]
LISHADRMGKLLIHSIEELNHPLVDRVRGAGLLLGVVLTQPVAPAVESAAREAGFLINAAQPDVLRLAPPLVLTEDQAASFVAALPALLDSAQETE